MILLAYLFVLFILVMVFFAIAPWPVALLLTGAAITLAYVNR